MDWKKLLGSLSASVDEELRLRNAYLAAENRILRQQIPGRMQLSDGDRHALAETLHVSQFVARKHWLRRCASLAVSAPISCKEASCFEADAVPCTLTSTSYKL